MSEHSALIKFSLTVVILLFLWIRGCQASSRSDVVERRLSFRSLTATPDVTVGVVTIVKDDAEALDLWLQYHVALFGVHNITVMDNFSTENSTIELLKSWEARGLNVLYKQGPYLNKGELTYDVFMKHYPHVDIAVPLDIDEFIIHFNASGAPTVSRSKVLEELEYMKRTGDSCWALSENYNSHCVSNVQMGNIDQYLPQIWLLSMAKKIVLRSQLLGLDHGNHHPKLVSGKCISAQGHLGKLHFHFRDPKALVIRSIRESIELGSLPPGATMDNIMNYYEDMVTMRNNKVAGFHKFRDILAYLDHGPKGLFDKSHPVVTWKSLTQILDELRNM
jgi:hypothetical protein